MPVHIDNKTFREQQHHNTTDIREEIDLSCLQAKYHNSFGMFVTPFSIDS